MVADVNVAWFPVTITSFVMTMALNSLVTGLIVFRILQVFLQVKAASTSVERSLGSTGGTKFQQIIFVIIESGMTLLVIQLVRTVLWVVLPATPSGPEFFAFEYVVCINEMFNVIIRFCSFLLLIFY